MRNRRTSSVARLAADVVALRHTRADLDVVLLADGAPEMWTLFDAYLTKRTLGVEPTRLVDFWHLVEYLGKAAVAMEAKEKAWPGQLRRWKKQLCEEPGAIAKVEAELVASGLGGREVDGQFMVGVDAVEATVADAIRYVSKRKARMDYARARDLGLPIGSGKVEATCKSLFNLRMKRPGARWKDRTGAEVIELRALQLSDRWDAGVRRALRPLRKPVQVISRGEALAA